MPSISSSSITYRPVMIFIDGGYLRSNLKELFDDDRIDFRGFARLLVTFWSWGLVHGELVRAYYYGAIVDPREDSKEFGEQKKYFDEIEKCEGYEIRLGHSLRLQMGIDRKELIH